jgi:hypothetical protein
MEHRQHVSTDTTKGVRGFQTIPVAVGSLDDLFVSDTSDPNVELICDGRYTYGESPVVPAEVYIYICICIYVHIFIFIYIYIYIYVYM